MSAVMEIICEKTLWYRHFPVYIFFVSVALTNKHRVHAWWSRFVVTYPWRTGRWRHTAPATVRCAKFRASESRVALSRGRTVSTDPIWPDTCTCRYRPAPVLSPAAASFVVVWRPCSRVTWWWPTTPSLGSAESAHRRSCATSRARWFGKRRRTRRSTADARRRSRALSPSRWVHCLQLTAGSTANIV